MERWPPVAGRQSREQGAGVAGRSAIEGRLAAGADRIGGAVSGLYERAGDNGIPDVVGRDGVEIHPPRLTEARELVDRCRHLIDPDKRGEISAWIAGRAMDPGKASGNMHGVEDRRAVEIAEDRRPPRPVIRVGIGGEGRQGVAVLRQQSLAVEGMHEEQLGAGDKRPVRPEEPLRRADRPAGIDGEGDRRRRFGRCLLPEGVGGAGHIPAGRPRILPRRHCPRDRLGGAVDDGDRLLINDPVDRHPGKLAVGVGEIGGG